MGDEEERQVRRARLGDDQNPQEASNQGWEAWDVRQGGAGEGEAGQDRRQGLCREGPQGRVLRTPLCVRGEFREEGLEGTWSSIGLLVPGSLRARACIPHLFGVAHISLPQPGLGCISLAWLSCVFLLAYLSCASRSVWCGARHG